MKQSGAVLLVGGSLGTRVRHRVSLCYQVYLACMLGLLITDVNSAVSTRRLWTVSSQVTIQDSNVCLRCSSMEDVIVQTTMVRMTCTSDFMTV